jgi:hypothetical protein
MDPFEVPGMFDFFDLLGEAVGKIFIVVGLDLQEEALYDGVTSVVGFALEIGQLGETLQVLSFHGGFFQIFLYFTLLWALYLSRE